MGRPKPTQHIFQIDKLHCLSNYDKHVPEIIVRSSQLKGSLQTFGCVDMMATEDTPTYCDFIKIFEEQNTKNNGQRERKHLQQKHRIVEFGSESLKHTKILMNSKKSFCNFPSQYTILIHGGKLIIYI